MISYEEFVNIYNTIRSVISSMTDNQKEIFLKRVGILMDNSPTLKEVAEDSEISRTRVSQIEQQALKKIYGELTNIYGQQHKKRNEDRKN